MSYADFTLEKIEQSFGIILNASSASIFPAGLPVPLVEPYFVRLLEKFANIATQVNTEKARSELLIGPILGYLHSLDEKAFNFFSGVPLDVDKEAGLTGIPDYILSRSSTMLELRAPICVIVEAKKEAILPGIPQCIAELIAAHRFNQRKNAGFDVYYGAVTMGNIWRFLRYEPLTNIVTMDNGEILFLPLEKLLAVLLYAVQSPKPLISA